MIRFAFLVSPIIRALGLLNRIQLMNARDIPWPPAGNSYRKSPSNSEPYLSEATGSVVKFRFKDQHTSTIVRSLLIICALLLARLSGESPSLERNDRMTNYTLY